MTTLAVIEDDSILAEMYRYKLEKSGYKCIVAHDGVNGYKLAEKSKPDLVLLDLMLPQLTGAEVLAKIRATKWGKKMKVIALTNVSEDEAPDELKNLGVSRYIVKAQHTPSQIIEIVKEVLAED